jgi:23S rRNA (uracil1939-C5)-methyltransferase
LDVEIEKLIEGGLGLARFEGIPILVPRSAPGDRLRIQLVERRPDYGRAEIIEILEPGPQRREPPCPWFHRCGGCDLQHLEDGAQTRFKVEAALETLRRLGGVELAKEPRVHVGDPWAYRVRAQFQVAAGEGGPRVGYFARGSHDVISVDSCPILVPELEELLETLGRRLPPDPPTRIDAAAGSDGALGVAPLIEGLPHGELSLEVDGFELRFDARCFVQGHRGLHSELMAAAVGDEGDPEGTAFDLFAGVGLFALPLSERYGQVVAVEADRVAARHARRNLKRAGARSEVHHLRVESWIPRLPAGAARVLVDPPRAGLHPKVRRALVERRARRLTYVSCQAATLARDLRHLLEAYRIQSVAFLDLFPQTGHLESVVQLVECDEAPGDQP